MLTAAQLTAVMPRCPRGLDARYADLLTQAMSEAQANTVVRASGFLAQTAHESGELRYLEEVASGALYEGRRDLGNTQPGDGRRYKGRGWIQLTGRDNYRLAGAALGLPLEDQPELAAQPEVAGRVIAWFWVANELNKFCDALDFRGLTRAINGGYNGLEQRAVYYHQALELLGRDSAFDLSRPEPTPAGCVLQA